jgi:hypothetical protein
MIDNRKVGKRTARRVLALLLLVGGGTVPLVHGQEIRRIKTGQAQAPEITIVRGQEEKAPAKSEQRVVKRPLPLSPLLKQSLLRAAGIILNNFNSSFILTPAALKVPGRAFLQFENPGLVDGGGTGTGPNDYPLARFGSTPNFYTGAAGEKAVTLLFPANPGNKFMIDFSVYGGDTYYVTFGPHGPNQTFSGTQHLVIIYEATAGGLAAPTLTASAAGGWYFLSVEVTELN